MSLNDKAMQVAAAAAGAAMAYYSFKKGGVTGASLGIVCAGLAATRLAAVAGAPFASTTPREVRQSVEVAASVDEAFALWSRFEDFPRFMADVKEVRKTGEGAYHWVIEGPLGQRIEWDAVVVASKPGRFITWRSTTADVPNGGEVHFEPTGVGARVLVVMSYGQPAGPIGAVVAKITGSDPDAVVRRDLGRFKQLIESGAGSHGA